MDVPEEDPGGQLASRPKFGFRIYENFRNIVKKSKSNYDLSEAVLHQQQSPTYEDVEVTGSHALSSLDSSVTNDSSLSVIKTDGNTTDDSGIDTSIDPNAGNLLLNATTSGGNAGLSPEPIILRPPDFNIGSNSSHRSVFGDIVVPIYSSVLKKKSNPARDFALTVLENDKKAVKTKETCDLNEISKLLTTTNQLLTRNSHLRASLTIKVQRSNSKKGSSKTSNSIEVVDIVIDESILRKDSTSADSGNASSNASERLSNSTSGSTSGNTSDEKSDSTSEEESCESTLPSLEPVNPFTRHNPARRPINGHNTMEVRRSIRLAPKTVATLASKFDSLLTTDHPKNAEKGRTKDKILTNISSTVKTSSTPKVSRSQNSREMKLGKKDIAQIIGTLEKLDAEAKKESLILEKNKKKDIDNLMKSTKSDLEKVELPSQEQSKYYQIENDDKSYHSHVHDLEQQLKQNNEPCEDTIAHYESAKEDLEADKTLPNIFSSQESSACTDKYLQTLQKIAKDNAETGRFRTSLPLDGAVSVNINPVTSEQPVLEIKKEAKDQTSDNHEPIESDTTEICDVLVTARPAIVTEDQMDSLSFYDDVRAPSLGGDLYESIAGSILNLAKRNSSMEDMYSSVLYSPSTKVS